MDKSIVFVTLVQTTGERTGARLLVDSIRAFGGSLSQCPIWLFEANPKKAPCDSLRDAGIEVLPLHTPTAIRHYYYADKVFACARAEERAGPECQSLVFLAPENLVTNPIRLFDLGSSFDMAVRPVHIQNVGLLASDPLDSYWKTVYAIVGVGDVRTTVESFVDQRQIRAYYNSAGFAANPARGLFRRWLECFETLVCDADFQSSACRDAAHQIFLHQAVLSTLIATEVNAQRLRILPPNYVYPYNLHHAVAPERRAQRLADLACIYYQDRPLAPEAIDDIQIDEALRAWLSAHTGIHGG